MLLAPVDCVECADFLSYAGSVVFHTIQTRVELAWTQKCKNGDLTQSKYGQIMSNHAKCKPFLESSFIISSLGDLP